MVELRGVINAIIFRNEDNGWTVLELRPEGGSQLRFDDAPDGETGLITAVGILPGAAPGERVELTGEWVEHRDYGRQFKFSFGLSLAPDGSEAVEKYLASGLIKGIGEATARNIVLRFGDQTLDILENQPHRLSEVKGIGEGRAQIIAQSYAEQHGMRSVIMALQALGITTGQAVKLYKLYGGECLTILRQNPYQLIDDVPGVGFRTADQIAQNAGFAFDSPFRISAGIKYTLNWARTEGGHTCLPTGQLLSIAAQSLHCDVSLCVRQHEELLLSGQLLAKQMDGEDYTFLPYLFELESYCAHKLLELNAHPSAAVSMDFEQELLALERESSISLDGEQRKAVLASAQSGVLVITGGPGTGKTTIVDFVITLMEKMGLSVELCAPTGRAAKRLSEATGREARTIHRLLEYTGEGFGRNQDYPVDGDVIIADEASMIDAQLLYYLLRAMPLGTRLMLVGDADQLPSVGAGNVLSDIIRSNTLPVVCLTEIFRQSKRSRIVTNAHRINRGEMPLLDFTEDFAFEEIASPERILQRIVGICKNGRLGDPWSELQVLSPTKKGVLGVRNLNLQLQAALNPPAYGRGKRPLGTPPSGWATR